MSQQSEQNDLPLHKWLAYAAQVLGFMAAIIGAMVFIGWIWNVATFRDFAGAITMKTNTALAITLAGMALLLLIPKQAGNNRKWAGRACAAIVLIFGTLSLIEHLLGLNLGIDQLLAQEPAGAAGVANPNRMGPPASLCFTLLGPALLLLSRKRDRAERRALHQPLALIVILVAMLPTIGYLYGAAELYGIARYTGTAWPTAASLLALGIGVLCARPGEGLMARVTANDPGGALIRWLLLPMILVPLALGWFHMLGERYELHAALGTATTMLIFIVVLSLLIYHSACRISRATSETEQQKELLAVTLASIGDGVIVTDTQGRITFLNGEAERLTGWNIRDAEGQPLSAVFQIVNADTRRPVESPVDKVMRSGTVVGLAIHTVLLAKDGREIAIDDSGAPIRHAAGDMQGVVLVFRDISERQRRERLLHTRLRLSEMAQHAGIDELIQIALDEAEVLTGSCIGYFHIVEEDQQNLTLQAWSTNTLNNICKTEAKGLHYPISKAGVWVDCFHKRIPVIHNDYAALAHKKGLPDGHAPIIRDLGVPVLRGDRVAAIIGVGNKTTDYTQDDVEVLQSLAIPLMDLVRYKQAEEKLREDEERRKVVLAVQSERKRFNDVLEMLPAYVILLTPDYHVPFANRFFEQRFGKSNGKRCFEYLFQRTEPCENCETYKVLKTGAPHHWEWTGPDGRNYDIHDFPFTDADGSPLIMEVGVDITERKRAEAALKQANDSLEQRVAQRTAALAESEKRVRRKLDNLLSPEGDIGNLELADIIDAPAIQSLMDNFYQVAQIPMAIIDMKGKVLVGKGWQNICTQFHRVHPETCKHCIESDTQLSAGANPGEFKLYKCKNNMWDIATPIMIGGRHLGNLFSGQFFFDDETPDYELFRCQAKRYGFDEQKYMAALQAVPRLSKEFVDAGMGFFVKLAQMISVLSYSNIKLAKSTESLQRNHEELATINEELQTSNDELQAAEEELCAQNEGLRRAQHALQHSEHRYRSLFETMTEGFSLNEIICDEAGNPRNLRYLAVNPAFEQQTGLKTGDILGRTIMEAFPQTESIWIERYGKVALTGEPAHFEAWFGPLGRYFEVSAYQTEPGKFAVIFLDITDRKRAEEKLTQAMSAAEAASEAKGRFLANMSHELRTPMNAILGMVDLALRKQSDPAARDFLQTAKESADLLLALLDDLLDSAKIEAGKLALESAPFSLRQILNQTTQVLAVRASEKGIAFSCHIPGEIPDALVGDQVRLRQVLLNLAGNGIKFTQHGEVTISVRTESQTAEEVSLQFAVRDTGIGIAHKDLDRIFRPFAQADLSTSRRFGGTGLGLTIAASLVDMMGGRIWAESKIGKGSTFYFTVCLPLSKQPLKAQEQPADELPPVISKLQILLVEDNPANQKLAAYILQDRGHAVDIASNGQEALNMSGENRYDVVLMDVQMPGMDGLEATKAIRLRDKGKKQLPIIAMTAHAMQGDKDRCLAEGMDGYLSKPINAQEMIVLIENLAGADVHVLKEPVAVEDEESPIDTVFDANLALKRCFNKPEIMAEMIKYFFTEIQTLMPKMHTAIEKGHLVEVGHMGHKLKGTLVYLGAGRAQAAANRLEQFEQSGGKKSDAKEALGLLEQECEVLMRTLTACAASACKSPSE